jgi:hypothetical protein
MSTESMGEATGGAGEAGGVMQLAYAPPAKSNKRPMAVVACGVLSTALVLLGVYVVQAYENENIMGWYANYVIPAGAIIVGLAASTGYGIASWATGVKIRRGLLGVIVGLQLFAYFAAHYIEFRSHGVLVYKSSMRAVTFPEYFHLTTTNLAWKSERRSDSTPDIGRHYRGGVPVNGGQEDEETGTALGGLGYLVRLGELLGFVGGSLIVPVALLGHPYCELCQLYMKRKSLVWIPASEKGGFMPKLGKAKQENVALQQQVMEEGQRQLEQACAAATGADVAGFRERLAALKVGSKKAKSLPARFHLQLVRCTCCSSGHLEPSIVSGRGRSTHTQKLGSMALSPEFVRAYVSG